MAISWSPRDIDYLLSPEAIRERTRAVYDLAMKGGTAFQVDPSRLDFTAGYVLQVIRDKYPDLKIPFHSRHGHFNIPNGTLLSLLNSKFSPGQKRELAKAQIDLVVVSVLLDAGAGDQWTYLEPTTKTNFARSEGLAVASLHMFMAGAFSSDATRPLQADATGLRALKSETLIRHFQVTSSNPLVGVEGRVSLLNRLGDVIAKHPDIFKSGCPSDLLDHLEAKYGRGLRARHVLDFVLRVFGDIWPSRLKLGEQSLGDVWQHSKLGPKDSVASLVPFHKLSQWLTYSILVPMIDLGLQIDGVDELTGLAEYRNGGLLIDSGLISMRNPADLARAHAPDSDLIIEWRALTVVLLDMIADRVRSQLKMTSAELPLAKVLEGGTWHAGRKIAKEKRSSGAPPLNIISDGTVF